MNVFEKPTQAKTREQLDHDLVNKYEKHISRSKAAHEHETNSFKRSVIEEDIEKQEEALKNLKNKLGIK